MALLPEQWHDRFTQQAAWTESLRSYLINRVGTGPTGRILEVGCGTGAVTATAPDGYAQTINYGLDIHLPYIRLARRRAAQENLVQRDQPAGRFVCADALRLPFPEEAFDAVFCHFFLLWVPGPEKALAEMIRAVHPGGWVLAFAEPDYGGRIDYPTELIPLGQMQAESLRRQGADPGMGRKLSGLFSAAGLTEIETGVLGGQWQGRADDHTRAMEWRTLEADLQDILSPSQLSEYRTIDEQAWNTGRRVLFVPTFYAIGRK
jgi:SAM-dependent methyltransferase